MTINYKLYHPEWFSRIRPDILKRAHNICEFCGAENYKPNPDTGSKVILTIAHLDQNIENNDYRNLAALCQRCHFNHDRPHNIQKIKRRYWQKKRQKAKQAGQLSLFEVKK